MSAAAALNEAKDLMHGEHSNRSLFIAWATITEHNSTAVKNLVDFAP